MTVLIVKYRFLFLTIFPMSVFAAYFQYDVQFYGVNQSTILEDLKSASDLILQQDHPPASINGLQYRIKADIPNLISVMKTYGYYDAEIDYKIVSIQDRYAIQLMIHPGFQYVLAKYEIFHSNCKDSSPIANCPIFLPEDLHLRIGQGADSPSILNAELILLTQLARYGYPLAIIDQRRVIVDMANKSVDAAVCVEEGPLAKFGPTTFFGLKSVNPRFIERKLAWKEGETFNSDLIDITQTRLLKSDLFSSVLVTHAEELDNAGELSMKVRLSEAKHRSIGLGFFYATVDGPGGTICWTHRNLRGMGEYLNIEGNASKLYMSATMTYRKPDLFRIDQTLSVIGQANRENIVAYRAFTYLESNRIEKQFDEKASGSIGLKGEYISVHKSVNNGRYFLLGLPIFFKYTTTNAPLDPTRGCLFSYSVTPYQSVNEGSVRFVKQRLTTNFYIPLTSDQKVVLAMHAQFNSIAGTKQKNIPIPKLFLGGSEDDLRGYGYKTVSPLGRKPGRLDRDTPRGGRSAIFTTVELRFRITKSIGIVPFADFGTVTLNELPKIHTKWYKSVGGGIRYFTFFGPLRLDVGFPLDRRKNLDTWGKIYASIGQCF